MCATVDIDDNWIETLGDLRRYLGREPIYLNKKDWYNASTTDNYCLCGVDMVATASLIGRIVERDDMGDLRLVQPPEDAR